MRNIYMIILLGLCFAAGILPAFCDTSDGLSAVQAGTQVEPVATTDVQQAADFADDWITRSRRPEATALDASPGPLRSIVALFVILGVLLLVRYMIQRKGLPGVRMHAPPLLRMVSRLRLGVRQELVVVSYRGRHLVLGVTPESIRMLTESAASDLEPEEGERPGEAIEEGSPDAS